MVPPAGDQTTGIQFEVLRTYPLCVAMTAMHPFARMKSIPLDVTGRFKITHLGSNQNHPPWWGLCRRF